MEEIKQEKDKNVGTGKNKKSVSMIMLVEALSILAGIVLLMLNASEAESSRLSLDIFWVRYVDIPAMVLILVLVLPAFISSGLWKDFLRAFQLNRESKSWKLSELKRTLEAVGLLQKLLVYTGILIVIFQTINVLYHMDVLSSLGPKVAMMLRFLWDFCFCRHRPYRAG